MATSETRLERGRRRGHQLQHKLLSELRAERVIADVSQREIAARLGWSQAEYWRFENDLRATTSLVNISEAGSLLGLEVSAGLHRLGDPIVDRGHQALMKRFRALLSPRFRVVAEVPLPLPGDRRSWDLLLRLDGQLTGVELETRIRDVQALVRRTRQRERDGGANEVVIVLALTRTNRTLSDELREALGPRFQVRPRDILSALRAGQRLPGSGVILV